MSDQIPQEYVLGIDLGSNSLGWAIIGLVDDVPANITRTGVRIFEAGVSVDPKSGREKTLNTQRREALQQRRQIWRHRRRIVKLAHILQRADLLPRNEDLSDSKSCQESFNNLDKRILASRWFLTRHPVCAIQKKERTPEQRLGVHRLKQLLPYLLRAAAVEDTVEDPHFVGRALYHLAQRRGFWSNRKTEPKKDEKPGEVEDGIKTLRSEMAGKTLGQFFASLSPFERRIRDRWTSRDMYQAEFKAIWERQEPDHPAMQEEGLRPEIFEAIFDQRRLRLKGGLVGQCEFEPGERRAPAHLLISQRFRLLQVVNNFRYRARGGEWQELSPEQRKELIAALERRSTIEFKEVRELLGFNRSHSINLQRDKDEARMPGNDTAAQLIGVFGEGWQKLLPPEQAKIVATTDSLLGIRDLDERRKRAAKYLANRGVGNLERACDVFLDFKFEAGHRNLSVKAMERFMPLLERGFKYGALSPHYRYLHEVSDELIRLVKAGMPHDEACEQLLNRKPEPRVPLDALPPLLSEEVQKRIGTIRNPVVTRSLTEMRKVVNAAIESFGKPRRIHIELLRHLKKPKAEREKIWKENLGHDKRNTTFEEKIKQVAPHLDRVRPRDIEKYRLWEESKKLCPYCLKCMTPRLMFGEDSEYQIDHIIPFGLSLDDSFVNKILCHTECNRRKGHRTPFQAFGENPPGYDYQTMVKYVKTFDTDKETREEKLRRFKMDKKALEEFLAKRPAQQFNDSAYASRLAADYLALLYGGRTDADGNLRVQARSGGLTKYFREAWNLNSILGDGESKNGGKALKPHHDHRKHAIDAAVIAATDQDMVRRLNDAAKRRQLGDPGRFADFSAPPRWPGFRNELKNEVTGESPERVQVSHRVTKKVSGALHEETIYSAPMGKDGEVRVRKPLASLTKQEVEKIADQGVRKLVQQKLEELGGIEPKKAFANPENLPRFASGGVVIKNARISKAVPTFTLGDGRNARRVTSESNHHVEMVALTDEKRKQVEWDGRVVPMKDAYKRLRAGLAVIDKTCQVGEEYRFSLCPGEVLECQRNGDVPELLMFKGVSQYTAGAVVISLLPLNDARKNPKLIRVVPNRLRQWHARKVVVSPLGEVTEAHD